MANDSRGASGSLTILVVEDEPALRQSVRDLLSDEGHTVVTANDGLEALGRSSDVDLDLVIADVRMPRLDGLTLFERLRMTQPAVDIILMTGKSSVDEAVEAMRNRAADYIPKPFKTARLLEAVDRVAEERLTRATLKRARRNLDTPTGADPLTRIVGKSGPMRAVKKRIATIADSDAAVVITGESGTGKELVARSIHELSPRSDKPLIAVNCAAFPENLLESELFGHERGAFTGASRRRSGRFRAADGGTLFLDEVVEMSPMAQAKLLRVLQEGRLTPLGTDQSRPVDVRILSACNVDLKERVATGDFREDLYFRLKVFEVNLPPLRNRRDDLAALVAWFLERKRARGEAPKTLSADCWGALSSYDFPGNVRELEHVIEHGRILSGDERVIELRHLPEELRKAGAKSGPPVPLAVAVAEFEREYLLRTLAHTEGQKTKAAKLLEVSRKTLYNKLQKHGIDE